ncbi:LLM class F420-dependent oxidoreductase [Salinibacterium sp. ZJ454]|uniref:LLM class F420-dependent oxidoreductase n=1 Tax=Salinibacterium sp. ZJ454 TaxID=2708339 RepID=UPI00141F8C3C|nr:LLM class F420-dependent oxidoreductase [Salinibacterium sp. ZJ454]
MNVSTAQRDSLKQQIGSFGIWRTHSKCDTSFVQQVERLGFGALWLGGSPAGDLVEVERMLSETSTLVIATGIINIWRADAEQVAESFHRVAAAHPGRFILGIGGGHPERDNPLAGRPYEAMLQYLDVLDRQDVPSESRMLAALGPRMLQLAADRSLGAHPYLTTPGHTREAREIIGAEPLLVPEQRIVIEADPDLGRELARQTIAPYLKLTNYRRNFERFGFDEESMRDVGSDALIDGLAAHGPAEVAASRLLEHLDAGADHVAVQVIAALDDESDAYRALAEQLELSPAERV